jgi:hypothetical protein
MCDVLLRYTGSILATITGTFLFLSLARSQDFLPGAVIVILRDDMPASILSKFTSQNDLSSLISRSYVHAIKRVSNASGIYIHFATQLDENNSEVQTKAGEFAVIR